MNATLTVLGSGTSMGVPTIGCECAVCRSTDPRDRRTRPSVLIQYGGKNILIDTTPDFREQAIRGAGGVRPVAARIALEAVFDRLKNVRLDASEIPGIYGLAFRSPRSVPVVFDD